ncbi:AI-2E family transporter [Oceanobacillus halotolerans]|uniref:AI-2E family transporter n=1 Tax=Oceanobacillus halotolerans TaxID=2663380 RepID=UPI0013DD30D6|nr:AI-2E family transporter [Oceanobacillus halotolerans]
MYQKRWFQTLTLFILIFLLILLISVTDFVFTPILKYIGAVAVPIIGAGILFYLTKPVMHFLERFKINRVVAILLVFLLLILIAFFVILYLSPILQRQFSNLMANVPSMIRGVENFINYWQANQIVIPEEVNNAISDFTNNLQTYLENFISHLFGFIGQLISIIASIVLIPFFLFFMLKDGEKLVPYITQIFEKKKADNIRTLLQKIDEVLTAFIQGQLIVSFCVGVLLLIGYAIIDLNYALTLALFGLVMNVVPFIGPFIAVAPAIIVGAFQDPMMIIWVSLIMIAAQQVESNFISPNVMGKVLDIHPLTIITVILAGGSIAGFLGILFAVPFYAVIKTIIGHFYQTYIASKEQKNDALI